MTTQTPVSVQQALPPRISGLPILGSALDLRIDPLRFLLRQYRQHGPVFRMSILGRETWIMAGLDANRFLAQQGEEHLGSERLFGGMAREMGSDALLTAIDGPAHRHQRKIQRRGYSREMIHSHLQDVLRITADYAARWPAGATLPIFPTLQRIVTDQLGMIVGGRVLGDKFDDVAYFFNTIMKVHVMKTHPSLMLRRPRYQKARATAVGFAHEALAWHRAHPPVDREPRLIDDLAAALDENGRPYSDDTLTTAIIGGYFAGMDTVASTAAFMLGVIISRPDLHARVRAEVDAAFDGGGLTPETLRDMPVLHHTAMETLRLYPVAPFTPRTVVQPFEFGGYTFPVGVDVYVGNAITHLLPEFFPDPDVFDIDRYDRPDFKRVPQSFAPYTLGAHTCLGAGMAEVQMMALIAGLVRLLDLELEARTGPITVYATPIPNPGRKLAMRVNGVRRTAL